MLSGSLAYGAVNVYTTNVAPPTLQNDIIAGLTTQYNATVTPGFFVGTYTVNVSSKIPTPMCGSVVYLPAQIDTDINTMVSNSTYSYVYGWAQGSLHQMYLDLGYSNSLFQQCNSSTTFSLDGSTNTVFVSSTTCRSVLNALSITIYNQINSTQPVAVPGF